MKDKIIILDFGSQYTQLIARKVRESGVFCEIHPYGITVDIEKSVRGIILSGSPCSVNQENAPSVDIHSLAAKYPVLGICYGAQLISKILGGRVEKSEKREYGRSSLNILQDDTLFNGIPRCSQVWMSHSDSITSLPEGARLLGKTESIPVAAYKIEGTFTHPVYGLQFHPEVYHSMDGKQMLKNFLIRVCGCIGDWTPRLFIDETIEKLKKELGNAKVVMGLSGGVDSTVAAVLIHRAIGERLHCIFIDNGLLRKDEFRKVLKDYEKIGLNIIGVDAKEHFYTVLAGKTQPEEKRKAIGATFIEIFDREAHRIKGVEFLGQGTIYPDVIESVSIHGPSATIKSHHNVGGLPEKMHLKLIEPLRALFKDEVRETGKELGISDSLLGRHPFPGPGLAIRIPGEVTEEKVKLLQEADDIFIEGLRRSGLYGDVWQAGAILVPVKTVGVMGDERTYEYTIALRAVTSVDGMTADWAHLPYSFLANISNEIINRVKGVNRVVYDISSKPPATIEWE